MTTITPPSLNLEKQNYDLVHKIKEAMTTDEAKNALQFLLENADFSDCTKEFKAKCFNVVFISIDALK